MKKVIFILISSIFFTILFQCNPERSYTEDSDAKLTFSLDTVYFDTVFTQVGTITKSFRIYNPHSRYIKIDAIDLAGGGNSVFRINVDGVPGYEFRDFEIAPGDSMYVFVEATPGENMSPDILRIQDSILFSSNGNLQDIDLVAWGQDVHILRDSVLDYSTTWTADKPYLVIDGILVDTLQSLTIEEGVQIYMHRDAGIYVKGNLKMLGSVENPVVIQGDRLEREYQDDPGYGGQWFAVYFAPGSYSNVVDHVKLYNGTVGLWADSVVTFDEPVLSVSNTEIHRMSYDGILARGTTIEANNTVIGDCGNSCVELLYEGSYSFTHCTFNNNWWQTTRKTPSVFIANYFAWRDTLNNIHVDARDIDKASFRNCIIYGSQAHEISISRSEDGILNYQFNYCLTKMDEEEYNFHQDPNFSAITNNKNPLFDSTGFALDSASPAIDKADFNVALEFPIDLRGNSRFDDNKPDLGAIERIEE